MGLEVTGYDIDQTILIATIRKDTTWADYHAAVDEIVKRAAAANQRIDVVFVDDVGMPAGNPLVHLWKGSGKLMQQPNIGWLFIAGSKGASPFFRSIMMTVGRIFKVTRRHEIPSIFFPTLAAAVAHIYADRGIEQKSPDSQASTHSES